MSPSPANDERLGQLASAAAGCELCPALVEARSCVVFGEGTARADVVFVAGPPGTAEDEQQIPLSGPGRDLLVDALQAQGLAPDQVFLTNVVMCRPPGNRAATPGELAGCSGWLREKIELIAPLVVCTLGGAAFKQLAPRGSRRPIRQLAGKPVIGTLGAATFHLLPLLHPASALYTTATVERLRSDLALLPELLAAGRPQRPDSPAAAETNADSVVQAAPGEQLGLF